MEIIGYISQIVVKTLGLNIPPDMPIYIGKSNIDHIKNRHPYEFDKYYRDISMIIASPDYVGINPKDGSISFVKLYAVNGEYIRVSVKIASNGKYFARTLHLLSTCNAERYLKKGTLKKLDTN